MSFSLQSTEMCQDNYEPELTTMQKFWLCTKKQPYPLGDLHLPGLIDYNENTWPLVCFAVAAAFEFGGLLALVQGGMVWYAAVAFFLIDIILAVIQHVPVKKICQLRNCRVFAPSHEWENTIDHRINKLKWLSRFLSLPIILVALVKVFRYHAANPGVDPLILLIIVSYFIVGVIHILQTGYFMFWFLAEIWDKSWFLPMAEFKAYSRVMNRWKHNNPNWEPPPSLIGAPHEINNYKVFHFTCNSDAGIIRLAIDRHVLFSESLNDSFIDSLSKNLVPPNPAPCHNWLQQTLPNLQQTGPANFKYVLRTWGILTDRQVQKLFAALPNLPGRRDLIKEIIRHQTVNIMGITVPWGPQN